MVDSIDGGWELMEVVDEIEEYLRGYNDQMEDMESGCLPEE